MKRIENNFNIVFSDEQSPYFQAEDTKRLVFPLQVLKKKPSFLNRLIFLLFDDSSQIDLTFFNSYTAENSSRPRYFTKQSLHKTISIRNWEEHQVRKPDSGEIMSFVTLKNIAATEIKRYTRALLKGKGASYVGFYNDHYLMLVDDDEVVIIVKHIERLVEIKICLQEVED